MRINDWLTIDEAEFAFSFVRSSGPGGQNVNKVATACELRFDARRSPSLPADVAVRLLRLVGSRATKEGIIILSADQQRSQEANRRDALERLKAMIAEAAIRPVKRVATKPTQASRKKRLEGKASAQMSRSCAAAPALSIKRLIRAEVDLIESLRHAQFGSRARRSAPAVRPYGQALVLDDRPEFRWPLKGLVCSGHTARTSSRPMRRHRSSPIFRQDCHAGSQCSRFNQADFCSRIGRPAASARGPKDRRSGGSSGPSA